MSREGGKRCITAAEYDAILAALRPCVRQVMRQFNIAPTTVGKMAAQAGRSSE